MLCVIIVLQQILQRVLSEAAVLHALLPCSVLVPECFDGRMAECSHPPWIWCL